MSKRLVVVGGATAVAGLVLGASIVFGPPAVTGGNNSVTGSVPAPNVKGNPTGNPGDLTADVRQFDYTSLEVDEDGQVRGMRLRARQANLKPLGLTELLEPRADVHLGPNSAITITADKADMIMDDGKPRRGQFVGNVVVTLFQSPEGVDLIIDPDNAKHEQFVQQRIYLDDPQGDEAAVQGIDFDIEDNRINTRGPVHVTSPQVDFFGIGLQLSYNTQRERIEQLIVREGRYLLFNPEAEASSFGDDSKPDEEDDKPDQPAGPSQYYLATFAGDVVVRDGVESELAGDELAIEFSLGTEAVKPKPITRENAASSRLPFVVVRPDRLVQADNREGEAPAEPGAAEDARLGGSLALPGTSVTPALPVITIPQANRDRSLFTHDPKRDLVVTWTGEMRIKPFAEKPERLADDDDVHVTLTGPNAYAQSTRNGELERLETAKLEYLLSEERTTAHAGDEELLRILSTALGGEITGTRLIVRQKAGTATILGPGKLTYTDKREADDDEPGKQLTLTWQNRLDLELYTEKREASEEEGGEDQAERSQTRILGVKTATFDGDVTARHPDFDLDTDKLTLAFARPDKKLKIDNHPTGINALGDIAITARGDDKDETFNISAQRLTIDLSLDKDKDPYASGIRALGGVRIERPGMWMTCDRVSVELNPPPEDERDETEDERFAQVRTILAIGSVRGQIDHDEREIDLVADQLIGDVENDRLTLSSDNPRTPAEVFDLSNQRKLTGQLVVMDDRAEVLTITGPGSLATKIKDPDDLEAGIEDSFLNIAWSDSMLFNNISGQAQFIGDIRSESRRLADYSELTCDKLVMQFSPDYEHDPRRLIEDEGEDEHDRQILSAVATGNVKFMAAAWELADPDLITNRMRLEGPKVVFTNKPAQRIGEQPVETVVVEGQGRMVLEDYRPPDKDEDEKDKAKEPKRAFMTGRGATLFAWEDRMILDARRNTATLLETVQMVHIPKDEAGEPGNTVQLDCNKLVADMTDTGGLSVWLSDDAPDAQVTFITADDNVRLLQQGLRSMRSDHLKFAADKNLVELWSDEGRDVIIQDLERDAATQTNRVKWDLLKDRIEIDELRGGVAPLE